MSSPDGEPFLSKYSDKRTQKSVITGEKRSPKTRKDTGAFSVRTKITKGRPADWANQNDVATIMLAQFGKDGARSRKTHIGMRPRLDNGRFRKILKGDDENIPPLGSGSGGHLSGQWTATREDTNATS
ncbi:hypothetical protein AA0242T_0250 [Acetobacter aceti NRIC 0242]|nr:hypothetical protein AA0242T_0250 [Acetobacter aceti NRIC 0242]